MSVLQHLYDGASVADDAKPAFAFPTRTVRGTRQIGIHWYIDRDAVTLDCSVRPIALPISSG